MSMRRNALLTPKRREQIPALIFQVAIILLLVWIGWKMVLNAQSNLERLGISAGFGFLTSDAGFDISQKLIDFQEGSSYLQAMIAAYLNTIVLALSGILLCSVLGLIVAFTRFSKNPVLSLVAELYVETFRNIPLLLQIFFWYFGVIASLPSVRNSHILGSVVLNNRGLFLPAFQFTFFGVLVSAGLLICVVAAIIILYRKKTTYGRVDRKTWIWVLIVLSASLAILLFGGPLGKWELPVLSGFTYRGGLTIRPEFVAMLAGLSVYNSTFMSEIFRSGIISISKGQHEAAETVGLSGIKSNLLIVLPQALRVAIPPAGGQLQIVIKASSLSAAIAYPDIMSVIGGTIITQTSQAIECMFIIMGLFLATNLTLTWLLNTYNGFIMRRGGR